MDDPQKAAFLEVVKRMPSHWTCVRCGRRYRNDPMAPPMHQAEGFEIVTAEDGTRKRGGSICAKCMKR